MWFKINIMFVVNCKVQYIRPKYRNLKEWMSDPNNVYIGRAGCVFIDGQRYPKISSEFANPYKIGIDGTRDDVIKKYRKYIENRLENDVELRRKLLEMKGKSLGCWCYPDACHGDVLLELIKKYLS